MTSTAVTKPSMALPPEIEAKRQEMKQRNAVAQAIRGQMWSKDLNEVQVRAVAQYAHENHLDPVRHIEILGGRVYLTADFWRERAAPLIRDGIVQPAEPDFVQADPRLDQLAEAGDEWAKEERTRRLRLRIQHGIPDKAAAACIYRVRVTTTGATIVGVNWCGGGVRQRDPVGDAEPTKTAETRAARRAWRQVADVVPQLAEVVARPVAAIEAVAEVMGREVQEAPKQLPHPQVQFGDYDDGAEMPRVAPQAGEEDSYDDR